MQSEVVEFTVSSNEIREIDDGGLTALDDALEAIGTGELMHLVNPRRIQRFEAGGPALWSVATVPMDNGDQLLVSYGNSRQLDPERNLDFEMSVRVPGEQSGIWAAMLLAQLARYTLVHARPLAVGDYFPFPGPITHPVPLSEAPKTEMKTVFVAPDPDLRVISAPSGAVEIRRLIGLYDDEVDLLSLWTKQGFRELLRSVDPTLRTDVARTTYAERPAFRKRAEDGSQREGSDFGFIAVPGVWWRLEHGLRLGIGNPEDIARIQRMARARLDHGRHLLVHDTNPENPQAVALEIGNVREPTPHIEGSVLIIELPTSASLSAILPTSA